MQSVDLVKKIEAAWKDAKYFPDIDNFLREKSSHNETQEARELFLELDWHSVPRETLCTYYPDVFAIGGVALVYYLPAFLICSILHPDNELDARLADGLLVPPKKPGPLKEYEKKFSTLTFDQRQVIALYLKFMAEKYDAESRSRKRILDSVSRFWGM